MAAEALASLALDNEQNQATVAELLVKDLQVSVGSAREKVARAISRFSRAHEANQNAIAAAGGVELVVSLIEPRFVAPTDPADELKKSGSSATGLGKQASFGIGSPAKAKDGEDEGGSPQATSPSRMMQRRSSRASSKELLAPPPAQADEAAEAEDAEHRGIQRSSLRHSGRSRIETRPIRQRLPAVALCRFSLL